MDEMHDYGQQAQRTSVDVSLCRSVVAFILYIPRDMKMSTCFITMIVDGRPLRFGIHGKLDSNDH